jgi:hypothetical protein
LYIINSIVYKPYGANFSFVLPNTQNPTPRIDFISFAFAFLQAPLLERLAPSDQASLFDRLFSFVLPNTQNPTPRIDFISFAFAFLQAPLLEHLAPSDQASLSEEPFSICSPYT